MDVVFFPLWKETSIYNMLQISSYEIPINKPLLSTMSLLWSRSSNTFMFREGMMTITLLDLAALFSLPPYREEFSPILKVDITKCSISFKKEHISYGPFINMKIKSTPILDRAEHIIFLLYWLCQFIGCPNSIKVTKEFLPLAVALADGQKLAIGSFVLSQFYRGMH